MLRSVQPSLMPSTLCPHPPAYLDLEQLACQEVEYEKGLLRDGQHQQAQGGDVGLKGGGGGGRRLEVHQGAQGGDVVLGGGRGGG